MTPASLSAATRSRTLGADSDTRRASAEMPIRGSWASSARIRRLRSSSSVLRFDGDSGAIAFDLVTIDPPVLRFLVASYALRIQAGMVLDVRIRTVPPQLW